MMNLWNWKRRKKGTVLEKNKEYFMITNDQIIDFGYAIVRKGRELNKTNTEESVVPMHDLLPEGVSPSFIKKTEERFVSFTKMGARTCACIYNADTKEYETSSMTNSFIGMYFKEGVSIDDNDAFRIGDNTLNGIERDELQNELEFTWSKSQRGYEMEL